MTATRTDPRPAVPRPRANFEGFVHREGPRLVDGAGRPLLLRGVGLGNWLLPEGYMWGFGDGAASPREIEALVDRLVGADAAERFWRGFREQFITERDIAAIAAAGFDHVRLPINARVVQDESGAPFEEGFGSVDRLIEWCRTHRLWVLLDLHGAPGGQTGTNIDDSPNGKPELFMDDTYCARTIELWREIARRYRHETVVLGYDLLNEPLPNEWQHRYAAELVDLYREITAAIREIDPDHLIMYEGMHWATNWEIFTEIWDENSALQFHKYWSPPDTASIAPFLEARERLGLPIYMGESGEHNAEWLYTAFRLYEAHDIGWNLWPWKKIDTRTSPVSITPPQGWDQVIRSIQGEPIEAAEAGRIFDDLLRAIEIDQCERRDDVLAAVFADRPPVIPAWGYGFSGAGRSFDATGAPSVPGLRSEDAVTMRFARTDTDAKGLFDFHWGEPFPPEQRIAVDLAAGQWLVFDVADGIDASDYTALDPELQPAPVLLERVPDGIRATAKEDATIAFLVHNDADYPLLALDDHENS